MSHSQFFRPTGLSQFGYRVIALFLLDITPQELGTRLWCDPYVVEVRLSVIRYVKSLTCQRYILLDPALERQSPHVVAAAGKRRCVKHCLAVR